MKANMVQPAPSKAGVVPYMIVPEVLKEDNYEKWSILMQHYLVTQDLWDIVLSSEMSSDEEDPRDWVKKNALALHVIKISCGAKSFHQIKDMNSAKEAWDALAHNRNKDTGIKSIVERKQAMKLLEGIKKGDFDAVKKHFETYSETYTPYSAAILENGSTALHVAITAGQADLAKKLISVMSEEELETKDQSGKTALSLVACKGSTEIVECLVKKNEKLLKIPDCEGKIPLVLACAKNHKSLTLYLYSVMSVEFLDPKTGDHGFYLLQECIRNHMFDIGLHLLRKFPDLTFHRSSSETTPIISLLVEILSVLSGNQPQFWRRLQYNGPVYAPKMLRFICEQVSNLDREQLMRSGAVEATFKAIELGYLDFVKKITIANPDIVCSLDPEHSRDMLMSAVTHRQEKIAKFLYGLDAWKDMTAFTVDKDQNNILHLAAKLAPASYPHIQGSDPVLHMQLEANWFEVVKGIVPQFYKEQRNKDGETASEVFRREHQGLLKEAQTWLKDTANFAAVIGTLIIGIMFAAGITVPGGNNQDTGLPIFINRSYFSLFVFWDASSVFFASLSVLLFLDFHRSSFTEEDFLTQSLTIKLAFSFALLFGSLVAMLLSFTVSIFFLTKDRSSIYFVFWAVVFYSQPLLVFRKHLRPILKILHFFIFRKWKEVPPFSRFSI